MWLPLRWKFDSSHSILRFWFSSKRVVLRSLVQFENFIVSRREEERETGAGAVTVELPRNQSRPPEGGDASGDEGLRSGLLTGSTPLEDTKGAPPEVGATLVILGPSPATLV